MTDFFRDAAEELADAAGALTRERVRLGVTGLSRSGKTVFITSLVHNLLCARGFRGGGISPLDGLAAVDEGRLLRAAVQDDEASTVPQFPYHKLKESLVGAAPAWPEPTTGIARIALDLELRRSDGWLDRLLGHRTVRLEIVDYPGEWLIDLPLLGQSYEDWSAAALERARRPALAPLAAEWLALAGGLDSAAARDEPTAIRAAESYAAFLRAAAASGFRFLQPGRFLEPGQLAGSPLLRFCPLPPPSGRPRRDSLYEVFRRRYGEYRDEVVSPFYREHFRRLDAQIVLVDLLGALDRGRAAFDDLAEAVRAVVESFRYGSQSLLGRLFAPSIERVMFAATKADHVRRADRPHLERIVRDLVHDIDSEGRLPGGAACRVMALAAIRGTVDVQRRDTDPPRDVLRGWRVAAGRTAPSAGQGAGEGAFDPGDVPAGLPIDWSRLAFRYWDFEPPHHPRVAYEGFPTLRLGEAAQFLIGPAL